MKYIIPFLFPLLLTAQNNEEFERIYTKTFLETSQKDFAKATFIADSLYSVSQNDIYKIKSLMLSASLFQQSSDYIKAVEYALKAKEISDITSNPIQSAKINGFLATQYRILKLYNQSNIYLNHALKEANKISNLNAKETFLGLLQQENAYYQIDIKNYDKAIYYIFQSNKHFKKEFPNYNHFTGTNYQLLGESYYQLKKYDESLIYYTKALSFIEEHPNNSIKSLVYNGMALCYIEKEDILSAEKYINLAKQNSEQSEYLALKKEFYKTYEKYYRLKNDSKELLKLKEKKDTIVGIINENRDLFIDNEQKNLRSENIILTKEKTNSNFLLVAILLFFLSLGVITYFYIKKIKLKVIQKESQQFISNMNDQLKSKLFSNREEIEIHPDTEKKNLKKLEQFEQSTLFNKKTISLPSLAVYCQTNTKYLSQIINYHKNNNFTSYINQLRINFIVKELQHNPSYRKYKIAALSEMTGFSSPSKFTQAFKKETKTTTTVYIKNMEKNEAL